MPSSSPPPSRKEIILPNLERTLDQLVSSPNLESSPKQQVMFPNPDVSSPNLESFLAQLLLFPKLESSPKQQIISSDLDIPSLILVKEQFVSIVSGINTSSAQAQLEVWKECEGYPKYFISTFGRLVTPGFHLSRANPAPNGYTHVLMKNKDDRRVKVLLHILVATAFIENLGNKPIVNHIFGIQAGNGAFNLEWVSHKENSNRKVSPNKTRAGRPVLQYSLENVLLKEWPTAVDAARSLDLHHVNIGNCCKGRAKTHGNYIWKYKDEVEGDLPGEEWEEIDNIPISSHGRYRTQLGYPTFGSLGDDGYMHYSNKPVHRLVQMAFGPEPKEQNMYVDHIDSNKTNNHKDNLRWVTSSQNAQYALLNKPRIHNSKVSPVFQFTLEGVFVKQFPSIAAACVSEKIPERSLGAWCERMPEVKRGYIWRYFSGVVINKSTNIPEICTGSTVEEDPFIAAMRRLVAEDRRINKPGALIVVGWCDLSRKDTSEGSVVITSSIHTNVGLELPE